MYDFRICTKHCPANCSLLVTNRGTCSGDIVFNPKKHGEKSQMCSCMISTYSKTQIVINRYEHVGYATSGVASPKIWGGPKYLILGQGFSTGGRWTPKGPW